jgi:CBS domain-containing protein
MSVGLISERDTASSTAMTVRDAMTTRVVRVTVETTVHDAANLMRVTG